MRVLPPSPRARKWVVRGVVVVLVLVTGGIGLGVVSGARSFQFFGEIVDRVDTTEKVVALTFDDGPHPAGTQPLLDTLARTGTPATFYLTGQELAAHPDLGAAIARAGHEIGNHSYSHERMVLVTPGWVKQEVENTDEQIRRTGYRGQITFRPPHGRKLLALPHYLAEHNRVTVTWDVEPNSEPEVDASAQAIVDHTVERVRPGSIILLHAMYGAREQSRLAVGPIVERLTAQGYRFVTVSDLLTRRSG